MVTLDTTQKLLSGVLDVPDEQYWSGITKYPSIIDPDTGVVRTHLDADALLRHVSREEVEGDLDASRNIVQLAKKREKLKTQLEQIPALGPLGQRYAKDFAQITVLENMAEANAAALYDEGKRKELAALQAMSEKRGNVLEDAQAQLKRVEEAAQRLRQKEVKLNDAIRKIEAEVEANKTNETVAESQDQLAARKKSVADRLARNRDLLRRKEQESDEWRLIIEQERTDEYNLRKKIEESLNRSLTDALGVPYRANESKYDAIVQKRVDEKLKSAYEKLARDVQVYESKMRDRFQDLVDE